MKRRQHFSVKPTRPANEGSPQRSQSVGSNSSHEKDRIVADAAFLTWLVLTEPGRLLREGLAGGSNCLPLPSPAKQTQSAKSARQQG
jgi:hypothetical protein